MDNAQDNAQDPWMSLLEAAGADDGGELHTFLGELESPELTLDELFVDDLVDLRGRTERHMLNDRIQEVIDARVRDTQTIAIGAILYDLEEGNKGIEEGRDYSDYVALLRGPAVIGSDDDASITKEYPPLMYLLASNQLKYLDFTSARQLVRLSTPEPFTAKNPWCPWLAAHLGSNKRLAAWVFKELDAKMLFTYSAGVTYGDSYLHEAQRVAFKRPLSLHLFMDGFVSLAAKYPHLIFAESRFARWTSWLVNKLVNEPDSLFFRLSAHTTITFSDVIGWLSKLAETAYYYRLSYIEGIKKGNDPLTVPSLAGTGQTTTLLLLFDIASLMSSSLFGLVHRVLSYRERDRVSETGETIELRLAHYYDKYRRMDNERPASFREPLLRRTYKELTSAYGSMIMTVALDKRGRR